MLLSEVSCRDASRLIAPGNLVAEVGLAEYGVHQRLDVGVGCMVYVHIDATVGFRIRRISSRRTPRKQRNAPMSSP